MTVIACLLLIFSGLLLMVAYAVGPFANEPWLKVHFRFKALSNVTQKLLKYVSVFVIIIATLQLIGVIPW